MQEGWTALSVASWKGHAEIVQILVQAGIQINIQGQVMNNIIYWLLIILLLTAVTVLIDVAQAGLTALMLATQRSHARIVQMLLDGKADPNITDEV